MHELSTEKIWQSWQFIYVGNGEYKIRDMNSGKLLSVCNNALVTANMEIRSDNNESGQIFRICKNDDGSYSFLSKSSNYLYAVTVENASTANGASVIQRYFNGFDEQKFELIKSEADCPIVVVPCVYGTAPGYSSLGVKSHPVYLDNYFNKYADLLSNATWYVYENDVLTYNATEQTVLGTATGLAWMEAYEDGKLVLVCYISVENILSSFAGSVQDYLYADGFFLGTISCRLYEENHDVDPLVMRTEWYLYAVKLMREGKTESQIRAGLHEIFGVYTDKDEDWQKLYSEIQIGANGRYAREYLTLSFDDAFFLLDFIWGQYATYSLATLDTVNAYVPITEREIIEKEAATRNICKREREKNIIAAAQNKQISGNYNPDHFHVVKLKKGDTICGLLDGQSNWYTTPWYVEQSGYNKITLNQGLQIMPDPSRGYRNQVGFYEVLKDQYVATGVVKNNPTYGPGGYTQFYIPNFSDILRLINQINLN